MNPMSMEDRVLRYIDDRRRLGYELEEARSPLLSFARYADREGHQGPVTIELAVRWATKGQERRPGHHARRLGFVRSFARHQITIEPATQIPPAGLLGPGYRRTPPYIYSADEVRTLLHAASNLVPIEGLRPHTYSTLFGLLASSGLRVSEALRLTPDDVDMDAGVLTVRETKFHKSRLVPLHPSTKQALKRYAEQRDRRGYRHRESYFFISDAGTRLVRGTVDWTFAGLRRRLGWDRKNRPRLPRIHDLRHTFACRRLLAWYQEGDDINQKLPALSTYLGHAQVTDTYWYLSAVAELMAIAAVRFERLRGGQP
jgi:integrase